MNINYHNKKFRAVYTSANSQTSAETLFHYQQDGNILKCEYSGGNIKKGVLIGLVDENGRIEMCYSQINHKNELMSGVCASTPEILPNGKIRLRESWQWTSGDFSKGSSIIEEM